MYKRNISLLIVAIMSVIFVEAQDNKEALAPAKDQAAAKVTNYGQGVDTLDVETSGNWLQKRVIWEDAQKKYEKIQAAQHEVLEARLALFENRTESDKVLNVFYSTIGFDQGELEEIVDTLLATLEKMKNNFGSLTDKEKEIQAKLYEHKNDLEQLKVDVKSLTDLDTALDNAVMQLVNQVTVSDGYESQAWQKFKAIGQELDDRKAKEYYLEMDALEKNIQAIDGYIKGALADYFTKVDERINTLIATIKGKIKTLQESGIDLKNQINQLEEAKKEEPKKAPAGWFQKISGLWEYPIAVLTRLWNYILSFFSAKK
jgi:archaellum component FlaC